MSNNSRRNAYTNAIASFDKYPSNSDRCVRGGDSSLGGSDLLVGFATTTGGEFELTGKIKSIQGIYYSEVQAVCDCLMANQELDTAAEIGDFLNDIDAGKLYGLIGINNITRVRW